MLAGESVALFDIVVHMHGLGDFDTEATDAVQIPIGRLKVKVLPLERIIASKRATGREKDRLILPVLEDAAAALRNRQQRRK
jgi:hypothetical protein